MTDDEIAKLCREWPNNATQAARAIIAAHTAKLLAGVEMPEAKHFYYADDDNRAVRKPLDLFTADQLQAYAAAAAAQARVKALDEAKGVCGLSVCDLYDEGTSERRAWNQGTVYCAAAIEQLKGGE